MTGKIISPAWLGKNGFSRRPLRSLQTPEQPSRGWSHLLTSSWKNQFKSILIAIKSWIYNICLTSRSCHLSWRPRASRCRHRYLWRRTWNWTEGKSQPTDVCWGLRMRISLEPKLFFFFSTRPALCQLPSCENRQYQGYLLTWQCLKALSSEDIPDFHSRVRVPRH